jgi:CRP-like cAMP-binding protein
MEESIVIKGLVDAIHPLDSAEWDAFAAVWTSIKLGRKEVLTAVGETERYLYVVTQGVQRVYYLDDADREATLVFTYAPSFGGVLDSFLLQQPSAYYYETLTSSELLRASYTDIKKLMEQYRSIEALIRKGVTMATSGVLERLVELQCFSAEEKFRSLLKRSPHILQLVPHKYLANYLGMDATNFSKLMNKVKI